MKLYTDIRTDRPSLATTPTRQSRIHMGDSWFASGSHLMILRSPHTQRPHQSKPVALHPPARHKSSTMMRFRQRDEHRVEPNKMSGTGKRWKRRGWGPLSGRRPPSTPSGRVLEDALLAEVVHAPAEEHHLGVHPAGRQPVTARVAAFLVGHHGHRGPHTFLQHLGSRPVPVRPGAPGG